MRCSLCNGVGMVRVPFDPETGGWEVCPHCQRPAGEEPSMGFFRRLWWRFLAVFHLSERAVCEMSKGHRDYHDYHDSVEGYPDHFVPLTCKRCGKQFYI